MNLERYWAKPDKTIQQHIGDLLTHLETLKTMGYIDSDDLYELVKLACYYHDIGKVTERFQQRVLAKEKQYFDPDREIPHNVLSVYFVNENQVQKIKGHDKRDYARVCFAVMYHHDYCDPIKTILEREDTIKENLAEVKNEIFKLSQKFYTQLAMVKDIEDIRAVKIKGKLYEKVAKKKSQCGMEFTATILHGKTRSEYYCHSSNRNGKNGGRFMVDWKS